MDLDTALTGKPAEGATATDILRADHAQVRDLFSEYREAGAETHAARVVVQTLCMELELHDALERDVFYPTIRELDPRHVSDALVSHEKVRQAVAHLRARADANEPLGDGPARLEALIEEHVREEEEVLFPKVEAQRRISLSDLGRELIKRKEQLTRSTESFEGPAT